ncbi:MAG: hypothetical protein LUQ11_06405, partial [Methylococcaceae bacterium]|nr:hypothetical protein [Methylococcaceae bacterium]
YNTASSAWNSGRYDDPYAQLDFDELLTFGSNMASIPAASRADVCQSLLKSQKGSSGVGIQLHLLVGRLFSDACGDIPSVLNDVASIPRESLYDERLQKLVAVHTEALKRMHNQARYVCAQENKPKTVQSAPEPKDQTGTKKDETRMLREKLEAIRSLEKQMDGTNSGK